MTLDLWALLICMGAFAFAISWQGLHLDWYAGIYHGFSSRDSAPPGIDDTLAPRLNRMVRNHVEGLALFTPMVVVAHAANIQTDTMGWAALAYAATRLPYTPAYAFGWTPWRSIIWLVGAGALLVYLVSILASAI
ncbi:MAG: MAPEG family protein [Pseudomonadota bacterium]